MKNQSERLQLRKAINKSLLDLCHTNSSKKKIELRRQITHLENEFAQKYNYRIIHYWEKVSSNFGESLKQKESGL